MMQTIKDLPGLVAGVVEAFGSVNAKDASAFEESRGSASLSGLSPVISTPVNCSDGVLRLLASDWGRAAPKTLPELVEALRANACHYPASTLSGVLAWLVRRGRIKRWKTDKGYMYVLAERGSKTLPTARESM